MGLQANPSLRINDANTSVRGDALHKWVVGPRGLSDEAKGHRVGQWFAPLANFPAGWAFASDKAGLSSERRGPATRYLSSERRDIGTDG